MSKSNKQLATEKISLEINKEINNIVNLSKTLGLGEMFFYTNSLHWARVFRHINNAEGVEKDILITSINHSEEAFRYASQLICKYGKKEFIKDPITEMYINPVSTGILTKTILNINAKHETLSMVTLFDDKNIILSGERNQFMKLDFTTIMEDEITSKYFRYFMRLHLWNDRLKNELKQKDDYILNFIEEYLPFKDLFEEELSISLEDFGVFVNFILDTLMDQVKLNQEKFTYFADGKIDIKDHKTIMLYGHSLLITKKIIVEKFGKKFNGLLQKLTFNADEFDEYQLKFNLTARQPFFDFGNRFLISPENLLDSLFVNSHYSLLESGKTKEEYKKRYSDLFLDKIAVIANKYGYTEVKRELDLFEGRNLIGDIDLILKNSEDHFLLIEAKSHTLPLSVYFGDYDATKGRLTYLKDEWEFKVTRRNEHVKLKHSDYGISSSFTYLIVSKFPEILAHFSELNVLEIKEFDYWLSKKNLTLKIDSIMDELYNIDEPAMTPDQLNKMMDDMNTGWEFKKE